jgi:hypothetical protein
MSPEQRIALGYCARTTWLVDKRLARDTAKSWGRPSRSALLGMRDAWIAHNMAWPRAET